MVYVWKMWVSFLMYSNSLLTLWFDANTVKIPQGKVFGEPWDFGTFRVCRFPESMRANYRVPLNPGTSQSPFTSWTTSLSRYSRRKPFSPSTRVRPPRLSDHFCRLFLTHACHRNTAARVLLWITNR